MSMRVGEPVEQDGLSGFVLKNYARFPGLEVEYVPHSAGLFPGTQCASIQKRLAQVEYTEVVLKENTGFDLDAPKTDVGYAWFADRGDWLLSLDKQQENAFVPMAQTEWLRSVGWSISERLASFRQSGTGFVGGGNAALVTWMGRPTAIPERRPGVDAPKWLADHPMTTIYMYFGEGGDRHLILSPGTDALSGKFFDAHRVPGVDLAMHLKLRVHTGSIIIVRGRESHFHWDMRLSASLGFSDGSTARPLSNGGDCYLVAFQTIAPLIVHHEHLARPPVRTLRGVSYQRRVVPAHLLEAPSLPVVDDEEEAAPVVPTEKKVKRPPVKRRAKK